MTSTPAETLLFLGLSGVPYDRLAVRIADGRLPALARLAAAGALLPLASDGPLDEAAAWTGIATGRPAIEHGVLLPDEPWAGGLRPVGRASWRRPAMWERLEAAGIATAGVGWPATTPGAAWPGTHVDDRVGRASGRTWDEWPLPPDLAPTALRGALREVRVHPADLDPAMLTGLVPDLAAAARDPRLGLVAPVLARTATEHAAAVSLARAGGWRALFVHHDLPGALEGTFGGAAAPFDRVADGGWTLVDALVGGLAAVLPDGCRLLIASTGTARRRGAVLLPGGRPVVASMLDLAPTVLALFGVGDPALPGRPLLGSRGLRPLPPAPSPPAPDAPAPADLARVRFFGLEPPTVPGEWLQRHRLARAQLLLASNPVAAGRLLDDVLAAEPASPFALVLRVAAHVALNEAGPLPALARALARAAPDSAWAALAAAAPPVLAGDAAAAEPHLRRAEALGGPDERLRVAAAWLMLGRTADSERVYRALLHERPDDPAVLLGLAAAAGASNRGVDEEQALRRLLAISPAHPLALRALDARLRASGRTREADALSAKVAAR